VNVHFPVAAVVGSVVEFELEGGSVPNMVVALGNGDGVLREALDDPGSAVLFVAVPQHGASLGEAGSHHANPLVDHAVVESDVVGGGPVVAALSVPLAIDDETLGQGVDEGIRHSLGESREEVETGMSFPAKSPRQIWVSVFSEAFTAIAPLMLAVAIAIAVAISSNWFVVEGTKQVPSEINSILVDSPVPVGVENGGFFVPPVRREIFSLHDFQFPIVPCDLDTRLPEFDILVDVSGVGAAAFQFESDQSVDVDFPVASGGGDPMRRKLADDLRLQDWAEWLETVGDALDVAHPCALCAFDLVGRPNVGAIFTSPMSAHVMSIFLTRIFNLTILGPSQSEVRESSPVPGAVVERRSLADCSGGGGDAVDAVRGARRRQEFAVQRPAKVPRVIPRRHGLLLVVEKNADATLKFV